MRIAIVDDNEALAKGIAWRLQDRGHATDLLHDGNAAADFLRDDANDIVILDINLPGINGLEILREMRNRGDQRPVLLLTARDTTAERVQGLDAGADDYLVKPFEMEELEARVRALSRRLGQTAQTELSIGTLRFILETRQVEIDGTPLPLPRREVSVLEALLRARGAVVSKSDLLEHVYGTGADVGESSVEAHVSRLRKKLVPAALDIRVSRGLGYSLQERT
ncbi:two-component system, OmpR family, response regulator [Mameliella alba]|uniref:response regulator transcription factor n=1 Tax=Mameliella alba TaxID=561184 RepID=UPI00088ADFA2|nr:response regulator transcription factor [Mameliella alba]OWV41196.1 DNA-binding response regulator [Mameliella alba]PTR34632.1 two-component system OmpR family response regulator [Mameliella alba]GGF84142.1 DNA-binding response regulator [Mameliella alba]SDE24681.1 two-component system, OmpR family, response regulator [Mameliella alba]